MPPPPEPGLGVQNGWYVGERKVVQEQVWLRASPSSKDERALDVELTLVPMDEPLTLRGSEGKSYGGFSFRFAPRTNTVITTPLGNDDQDLMVTRMPWADFSAALRRTRRVQWRRYFCRRGVILIYRPSG
jgi:hypothetical protein